MFTGIVRGRGLILAGVEQNSGTRFCIRFPDDMLDNLQIGASVAVDGVCLTVVEIHGNDCAFDAVTGTLALTNLSDRKTGDEVNLERSARYGDEVGGHGVSGHVSTTAKITSINLDSDGNSHIAFQVSPEWAQYIFLRGFLAVDGASLTVAEIDAEHALFRINLIPETIDKTCLRRYRVGDRVNIEIEHQTQVLVDTLTRILHTILPQTKIIT
jgi:riboflavin synthase